MSVRSRSLTPIGCCFIAAVPPERYTYKCVWCGGCVDGVLLDEASIIGSKLMSTSQAQQADATDAVGPNIVRVGDLVLCSGIAPTLIPTGGAHVRQVAIDLPMQFERRPTVTAVIHPREDPAAGGVAFAIYNITVVPLGTGTRIKVSATNNAVGQPVDGLFECDYVVIGKVNAKAGDAERQ